MSLEIIDDQGSPIVAALQRVLTTLKPDSSIDTYLININMKGSEEGHRVSRKGLDEALRLIPATKPVILFSIENEEHLMTDPRFRSLIGMKKVGFISALGIIPGVFKLYEQLAGDEKIEDTVAVKLGELDSKDQKMGFLRHDLKSYLDAQGIARIAQRAREEIGLVGTDEEIAQQIRDYERPLTKGIFAGQRLPGIFCDVEDTLLVKDGVNQKVLQILNEYADKGQPVTLWTGGDVEAIVKQLRKHGIVWKLVSKYDFEGATVETAIDNESQDDFEGKYRIKPEQFVQIS